MRHLPAWTALFLLSACAADPGDTGDDPADTDLEADADTDADSDADTDADTDTDTEPLVDCLPHHGIHSDGSTWTYRWHNPSRTGGRAADVYERSTAANTATVRTRDNWTDGASSFAGTSYEYFHCDASGLYLLKRISDTTLTIAGTPTTTHSETLYSTAPLLRPNSPKGGTSWSSHAVGATTTNSNPPQSFDTTTLWGVTQEGVATADGFTAIKIESPSGSYIYWQEEVGLVYDPSIAWLSDHAR